MQGRRYVLHLNSFTIEEARKNYSFKAVLKTDFFGQNFRDTGEKKLKP